MADGNTTSPERHLVWSYILGSIAFLIQAPFSLKLMTDPGASSALQSMRLWSVLFFAPSWVIAIFGIAQSIKTIKKLIPTGKTLRWAINAILLNVYPFMFVIIAVMKVYAVR